MRRIAISAKDPIKPGRRQLLQAAAAATAGVALSNIPLVARLAAAANANTKIGVIGSGKIGALAVSHGISPSV